MIHLLVLLPLLAIHYLFDFKFQTHQMSVNKSKCNKALGSHVAVYTGGLILFAVLFMRDNQLAMLSWVVINSAMHFCTDWVTSRMSSLRWRQQRWHDFFEVVGADQLIHYTTLTSTYVLLRHVL